MRRVISRIRGDSVIIESLGTGLHGQSMGPFLMTLMPGASGAEEPITHGLEYEDYDLSNTDTHKPARPMKFFKDENGCGWLCDKDVDPDGDLEAQGCWRCDEVAFPFGH